MYKRIYKRVFFISFCEMVSLYKDVFIDIKAYKMSFKGTGYPLNNFFYLSTLQYSFCILLNDFIKKNDFTNKKDNFTDTI